jgi:uroporphyrinogen decarboxylase
MVERLEMPLQGNINPALLFAGDEALHAEAASVVESGRRAPGHVVNLGHGVPADADPDTLTRLVEYIHSL